MLCWEPAEAASLIKASGRPNEHKCQTQCGEPDTRAHSINGRSACVISVDGKRERVSRGDLPLVGNTAKEANKLKGRERKNQGGRERGKEIILKG